MAEDGVMATTSEVRDQTPSTRDRLYGWKTAAPLDHSLVPDTPIELPPGPRTPGLLQTVLVWGYRPQYLPRMHEKFGDTFTLNSAPVGRLVVTRDADAIREIFRTSPDIVHAGEGNSLLRPLVGNNSVLTLDAPEHQPARKRLLPPFHGARIARVVSLMEEATTREVATWPVGEDFPLLERTQALTLDIIVRVVMGVDDPARAKRLGDALRGVLSLGISDMLMWVAPGLHRYWPWRNVIRQLDYADELLYEEIERRRNDPDRASRPDVLSMENVPRLLAFKEGSVFKRFVKTLHQWSGLLEDTDEAFGDLDAVDRLDEDEARRLVKTVSDMRLKCDDLERALRRRVGGGA